MGREVDDTTALLEEGKRYHSKLAIGCLTEKGYREKEVMSVSRYGAGIYISHIARIYEA